MSYHQPVLLQESINGLNIHPDGIYADVTLGGGGHAREILKHLKSGRLIAFDRDEAAFGNLPDDERIIFVRHNYRFLKNFLRYYRIPAINGLIADLGVSSHHFDRADRGFSFRFEGPLDMRMNRESTFTASNMINSYSEQKLAELFRRYGELSQANHLAAKIVESRSVKPVERVEDLLEVISKFIPERGKNQFLAKVFQAIRIEVNRELESLKELLQQVSDVMVPGGRLVVISYHSLEDRLVKNFIRSGNFKGKITRDLHGNFKVPFKAVNRKVITPSEKETEQNPRARSAKLRIAEKTGNGYVR